MEVLYRAVIGPDDPVDGWDAPNPHTEVLKKGSVNGPDAVPLRCDILMERDASMELRDGTRMYTDIFRPVGDEKVPAIICWSPYGKDLHRQPFKWYSPFYKLSNLQKFEALDPEYWVAKGYAIINPDARGAFNSEGNTRCWCSEEGKDIYDFTEWLSSQEWCNGKVAMAGNSWLTVSQYFCAAQQPPHLAAIAPWEGLGDVYRDNVCKGGIPDSEFLNWSLTGFHSRNLVEDVPAMLEKYPLFNEYWQNKVPEFDKIQVPAYFAASFTNLLHVRGSFHAFQHAGSKEKWLRVHNTHEWTDIYAYTEDLNKFFDHYLKDMDNGWENTPKVRMSVLNPGGKDIVDRPEADFPIPRTTYKKLYLNASNGSLTHELPEASASIGYDSEDEYDFASFICEFDEDTELTGYFKIKLWVSADDAQDLDVFVNVHKLDANNNLLAPTVYGAPYSTPLGAPHYGAHGRLRVSLRALDEKMSSDIIPYHAYNNPLPIAKGEIVPVEIGLWPMGMIFEKGQKLRVVVSGIPMQPGEFLFMDKRPVGLNNHGTNRIHTGGSYDSYLQIPYIPSGE